MGKIMYKGQSYAGGINTGGGDGGDSADDSGWLELSSLCKYRKKNGIVTVRIYGSLEITTSWVTKGTLPSGYRPSEVVYQPGFSLGSSTPDIVFLITSGGEIQVRSRDGASTITMTTGATITYPV